MFLLSLRQFGRRRMPQLPLRYRKTIGIR